MEEPWSGTLDRSRESPKDREVARAEQILLEDKKAAYDTRFRITPNRTLWHTDRSLFDLPDLLVLLLGSNGLSIQLYRDYHEHFCLFRSIRYICSVNGDIRGVIRATECTLTFAIRGSICTKLARTPISDGFFFSFQISFHHHHPAGRAASIGVALRYAAPLLFPSASASLAGICIPKSNTILLCPVSAFPLRGHDNPTRTEDPDRQQESGVVPWLYDEEGSDVRISRERLGKAEHCINPPEPPAYSSFDKQ